MNENGIVSITFKDLYCIARLMQAYKYTGNPYSGCQYCKFSCTTDWKNNPLPNEDHVLMRLQDITGINLMQPYVSKDILAIEKSRCGDNSF